MKTIMIAAAVIVAVVVPWIIFAAAVAFEVAGYIMKEFGE